jgi:amino-acid N-acetyltransferase
MLRLTDLRQILRYVPSFRDKCFVIALDGAVVDDDNFGNLLLDIALLRSLSIGVVLVHGAGAQIRRLAGQTGQAVSSADGTGVTDAATLELSLNAANRVTHEILEGLAAVDLRGACGNAVVAHPAGVLRGVDHQFTGRVERVDTAMVRSLLQHDIVPVVPPLGCDGEGQTYRLNSDAVAFEVARAMQAVKLIYLTTAPGVHRGEELLRQLTAEDADAILKKHRDEVPAAVVSKLEHAVRAVREGVPRVHIIDGRVEEGLLAEVFSNEGIGTLVHANDYQSIRRAKRKDVRGILALIQTGIQNDELVPRTEAEIERQLDDYHVCDVDRSLTACVALHLLEGESAEMACVCVDPRHENQGIGAKMVQFVEGIARQAGVKRLVCLSTQAVNYFVQKGGFRLGSPDDLPPRRREKYDKTGRRSKVLLKDL